jgi:nitroreductase
MCAPSAHNFQPWELLVVREKEAKAAVSTMSPYSKMAKDAAALIVVLGVPAKSVDGTHDWWAQDCAAVTENILLQAVEEKLGAVWLGWHPNKDRVKTLAKYFKLPKGVLPFSVICLGYPADPEKAVVPRKDKDREQRIHFEQYE